MASARAAEAAEGSRERLKTSLQRLCPLGRRRPLRHVLASEQRDGPNLRVSLVDPSETAVDGDGVGLSSEKRINKSTRGKDCERLTISGANFLA